MVKDLQKKFDLKQCIFCHSLMLRGEQEVTSDCANLEYHLNRRCWINYDKIGNVYSACFKINLFQINFFVQNHIETHIWVLKDNDQLNQNDQLMKFNFIPECELTEKDLTKTIHTLLNFS